ncbi:flavin reductase [Nitzschia inconspicua]|uniref:Flavin reductase n=1 Tax=Nitzschia inconspicua TaxID=303405 RepID=A0A9K3KRE7_9STRA|nr:flavin reductase [Nitzschia inconspicua]
MKVAVIGANGDSGSHIVTSLVERGHQVLAVVRRPETITETESIQVRKLQDIYDVDRVKKAIEGADAVVSALGSGTLKMAAQPTTLYSQGTRTIRRAMRQLGIQRLIVLSSGGVEYDPNYKWIFLVCLRRYLINTYLDMALMDGALEEVTDLEWTSVRLPYICEGPSKPYIVKDRHHGPDVEIKLHFCDVGDMVAKEIDERKWIRKFAAPGYIP